MHKAKRWACLGTVLLIADCSNALAEESGASMEGVMVGAYQTSSTSRVHGHKVKDEFSGGLFLEGEMVMGPGQWRLQVRGSTSPRHRGITHYYETNETVGETLDSSDHGRVAVTELAYELPAGPGKLRMGFLDQEDYVDDVEVVNDEYTQFMADAFATNTTIGVPDYALGIAYEARLLDDASYKLLVGSDSGLEAEGRSNYHNVFSIAGHRDGHRKGAFIAGELGWHHKDYWMHGGIWYDTGRTDQLRYPYNNENAFGLYGVVGARVGAGRIELRGGIANQAAQAEANLITLAYQLPFKLSNHDTTLGLAVGRTGDSDKLSYHSKPTYQAEAYWRLNVAGSFYVSPDIQFVKNSDFDPSRSDAVIGGVRVGVEF